MEYSLEELLPVVEKLSGKYTSNESSSITYETAELLMEAVLYCIEECREGKLPAKEKLDAADAYRLGYDMVISKVYKAKEIYESLLEEFYDFQCRNCRDTIIKGIPQFFLKYDPLFRPQDTVLTLDYPAIGSVSTLCGADAVYQYICNIKTEWDFLNIFAPKRIEHLLERILPDYRNLYFDNISYTVLLTCLGCMIADKPVAMLELQADDEDMLESFFGNDSAEKAEQKIRMLISKLINRIFQGSAGIENYFLNTSNEYAVRIVNGIRNHSLGRVFGMSGQRNDSSNTF